MSGLSLASCQASRHQSGGFRFPGEVGPVAQKARCAPCICLWVRPTGILSGTGTICGIVGRDVLAFLLRGACSER